MQNLLRSSDMINLWATKIREGGYNKVLLKSRRILPTYLCRETELGLERKAQG